MAIKTIAYSYWRSIKRGNRTFDNVIDTVKDDVLFLAKEDVLNNVISKEQYNKYIGQEYQE